jgi:hypothetical protein
LVKPHRAAAAGAMRLLFSDQAALTGSSQPPGAGRKILQHGRIFKSIPSRLDV